LHPATVLDRNPRTDFRSDHGSAQTLNSGIQSHSRVALAKGKAAKAKAVEVMTALNMPVPDAAK